MDGPTQNQNNLKQDHLNKPTAPDLKQVDQIDSFKKAPLPSIEVKLYSNKREDLPYLIFPKNCNQELYLERSPILVVNGMNMNSDSILNMAQNIADKFGRPALMIPNHTEGKIIDIRNCIVSAFSSQLGVQLEKGAAGNLAQSLVSRLHDNKPIEIMAYSQGTLITNNVLTEFKNYFFQNDQKENWDNLAARINLRTFGAATHVWPDGIGKISEYRHLGDPVAGLGNYVSAIQIISKGALGDRQSEFASQIKLPVFKNAHSISNYLGSSNFYLKELKDLDPQSQAERIISSMKENEFSPTEYNNIIQAFAKKAMEDGSKPKEKNNAIYLAHLLAKELVANQDACLMLNAETVDSLTNAAVQIPDQKAPFSLELFKLKQ